MASQIKINTKPVADAYAAHGEKVIEFSSPTAGGLISFALADDGRLTVTLYRLDPTVDVSISDADQRS